MIRPHKLVILLLVAGSAGCGKSSKPTAPVDPDAWVEVPSPGGQWVGSLVVIDTTLIAGTGGGVFRSTDNAASWARLTTTSVNALVWNGASLFAVAANQGQTLGVFRSTDNGANWTPVNGLPSQNVGYLAVCGTSLFVTGISPPDTRWMFRSTDNGASWTAVNTESTGWNVGFLGAGGTNLFAETMDSTGTYRVFRSADDGANWTAVTIEPAAANIMVHSLVASGTSLFLGAEVVVQNTWVPKVYRSTDQGVTWIAADKGIDGLVVGDFLVSGTSLFAGTFLGVYRTTDNGANWTQISSGMPWNSPVNAMAVIGTSLFAAAGYYESSSYTWRPAFWRRPL